MNKYKRIDGVPCLFRAIGYRKPLEGNQVIKVTARHASTFNLLHEVRGEIDEYTKPEKVQDLQGVLYKRLVSEIKAMILIGAIQK